MSSTRCIVRSIAITYLELRLSPATLLHSLFSSAPGPQQSSGFAHATATGSNFRVVGAPFVDALGVSDVGQAYVYDALANSLAVTLNNPSPAVQDTFGTSVATSGNFVVVGADRDDTGATNSGSAYVFDMSSPNPAIPVATLTNPTPAASDSFGASVAIAGQYVIVGAYLDDTGATDSGSAYVYDIGSTTPNIPIVTLQNPGPTSSDYFGWTVAVSGKYVVVGAYQDDTGATDAGSAYLYDLTSATPSMPTIALSNPAPTVSDNFGVSVAVDGKYVVVGAYRDDGGAGDAGTAYVYDISGPVPTTPINTFSKPNPAASDYFGWSVGVSAGYVIVGAYQDDTGAANTGSAYIYDLKGITPNVPAVVLNNPNAASGDNFGWSVAASGKYILTGARLGDLGVTNVGSAFVYDLTSMTANMPIATLDNPSPAVNDQFGTSVTVSANTLVVGSPNDSTVVGNAGSASVFDLNSASPSTPIVTLQNPEPGVIDHFGEVVAISGTLVIVGAGYDDAGATDSGSAYVYDLNSAVPSVPLVMLHNPSPALSEHFGNSVGISKNYVVVGTPYHNVVPSGGGAAYIYDLNSATPTVPAIVLPNPHPGANDYFGYSAAVSGKYVAIGAVFDDDVATDSGAVFIYDLTSITPYVPVASLYHPSPAFDREFGGSVAMSDHLLVVGSTHIGTGSAPPGAAFVYELNSLPSTVPIATPNNPNPTNNDRFGFSVSVSGNYVVIGKPYDDTGVANDGVACIYDLGSPAPNTAIATLNNPTSAANDHFGNVAAVSGNFVAIGAPDDDTRNLNEGAAYVYGVAPAKIGSVRINNGLVQRSRVTACEIDFDQFVTVSGPPESAIQLRRQSDNALITTNAVVDNTGLGTAVKLTFVGGAVEFGSLADGRYTLTIDSSKVLSPVGMLDGNGDGIPGGDYVLVGTPANSLFRLFGDSNGDGTVNGTDFLAFRLAFLGTGSTFDFNSDGQVNGTDFLQFRLRFLQTI